MSAFRLRASSQAMDLLSIQRWASCSDLKSGISMEGPCSVTQYTDQRLPNLAGSITNGGAFDFIS